jgi:hypothetical protein
MRRLFFLPLLPVAAAAGVVAAYEAGTTAPLSCVPNLDGVIQSSEVAAQLGVPADYTVNPAGSMVTVDVAGEVDSSGQLVWDWGASYANDQVATITATALTGKWYASSFPNGQFVVPYNEADTLEAVYSQDDNGMYLQGLASTQQNPVTSQTLYVYETPVTLYTFPLKPGATWSSTGVIRNGTLEGEPYAGQDEYQGTDDATGQLILPDYTFTQAHRIRFVVTLTPAAGGNPIVTRQVSFMFECFGEIGRATSQTGETNDNFTTAIDYRRLGM